MNLAEILNHRLKELGWSQYKLAVAYGRLLDPNTQKSDRELGMHYNTLVAKALKDPYSCRLETIELILKAMNGSFAVDFVDRKRYAVAP